MDYASNYSTSSTRQPGELSSYKYVCMCDIKSHKNLIYKVASPNSSKKINFFVYVLNIYVFILISFIYYFVHHNCDLFQCMGNYLMCIL